MSNCQPLGLPQCAMIALGRLAFISLGVHSRKLDYHS